MYYDNPAADLDYTVNIDYAAQDAADQAEADAWLNRLSWLTAEERAFDRLAKHPAFPGMGADEAEFDAFAMQLRRDSERRVPCQFDIGGAKVRGAMDLASGATYLLEDGQYTLGDALPETVTVVFADEPSAALFRVPLRQGFASICPFSPARNDERVTLCELLRQHARPVSAQDMEVVVERLAKAGKLPAVSASVNGRRFGTYHPL